MSCVSLWIPQTLRLSPATEGMRPCVSASFRQDFLFCKNKKSSPRLRGEDLSSRYHPNYPPKGHLSHPVTGMNRSARHRLLQSGCFTASARGLHRLPSRWSLSRKTGFVVAFSHDFEQNYYILFAIFVKIGTSLFRQLFFAPSRIHRYGRTVHSRSNRRRRCGDRSPWPRPQPQPPEPPLPKSDSGSSHPSRLSHNLA